MKTISGLRLLKMLLKFLETLGHGECKTIGNGHPEPYHCFSCTFNHLHDEVLRAVQFWSDGNRAERAKS